MECVKIPSWDPLHEHDLTIVLVGIGNYIQYKVWNRIILPFPNFNGATVEVGDGLLILSHILLGMWLLVHAGFKVISC